MRRRAIRGECDSPLGCPQIRRPSEMAPIVAHSTELLRMQPELAGRGIVNKSQLWDLQTTLGQISVMLLARQASLEPAGQQIYACLAWMGAFADGAELSRCSQFAAFLHYIPTFDLKFQPGQQRPCQSSTSFFQRTIRGGSASISRAPVWKIPVKGEDQCIHQGKVLALAVVFAVRFDLQETRAQNGAGKNPQPKAFTEGPNTTL